MVVGSIPQVDRPAPPGGMLGYSNGAKGASSVCGEALRDSDRLNEGDVPASFPTGPKFPKGKFNQIFHCRSAERVRMLSPALPPYGDEKVFHVVSSCCIIYCGVLLY